MPSAETWAKARELFLKDAYPKKYARMQKDGTLAAHLKAVGRDAQDMWEDSTTAMITAPDLPTDYVDRVKRLEQIPEIVRELVNHELIHAPLSCESMLLQSTEDSNNFESPNVQNQQETVIHGLMSQNSTNLSSQIAEKSAATEAAQFVVWVDDNFHYQDENERYRLGTYPTYDEAQAACQRIITEYLMSAYKPGMSAEDLYDSYVHFGEDPWIEGAGADRFSFGGYAKECAAAIAGAGRAA